MKNKLPITFLVIGILLILLGLSSAVYIKISFEKQERQNMEQTILEDYSSFEKKAALFNDKRMDYYDDVVANLFVEEVKDNYNSWVIFLDEYTRVVDDIENESLYLKDHCVNNYFSNKDVSNACSSFVISYETIMNYYAKDIISFNEIINKYRNDYDISEEELLDYNLKYNYTDINDDGRYIGKD